MQPSIGSFQQALISLDRLQADTLFNDELAGRSPIQVVEQMVVPALERIGFRLAGSGFFSIFPPRFGASVLGIPAEGPDSPALCVSALNFPNFAIDLCYVLVMFRT